VPARSPDARHRAGKNAPAKPRRLIAGLALPTAAAVVLMFTATGAAMATSAGTQTVTVAQTSARVPQEGLDTEEMRARSRQTAEENMTVFRATAAARVARSLERSALAAKALKALRAAQAHTWRLPIKDYVLTSGFGFRWGSLHAGEDFAAPVGTDLAAMSTGTVEFVGAESGFGNLVKIRYWDGTTSFYAHMSTMSVSIGEAVEPGQVVGQSGNTGRSTGPHLHLEIHPGGGEAIDPLPWLADRKIAP